MRIGLFTDAYLPDINGVVSSVVTLKKALEELIRRRRTYYLKQFIILINKIEKVYDISGILEIASMEEEATTMASIDERLKSLKLEDEGRSLEDETMFSPELDEKVVLPHQNKPTVGQMEAENNILEQQQQQQEETENNTKTEEPQKQEEHQVQQEEKVHNTTTVVTEHTAPQEKTVHARVVVGSYATEKQAEVAKSIIQEAGLSITPIVKNIGGYYTLQVGSYNSKEKAQQMMNSLLKSNFPARVIVEYQ